MWVVTNGIRAKEQAVCQRGRWAPRRGGLSDPTSVGEGDKTFLVRGWKPLPNRRFKRQYIIGKNGQYGELGHYKWYQS